MPVALVWEEEEVCFQLCPPLSMASPPPHPWGEGGSSTLAHNLPVTGWDLNP